MLFKLIKLCGILSILSILSILGCNTGVQFGRASYNQVWRDSTFTCETFAIGSEMSGGVFNITVDNCVFGTDGTDYAGIHFKAPRGRGGSIHDIRIINSVIHLETSTKMGMPFSASMFYEGNIPRTNASATPKIYNVLVANLSVYLPKPSQPSKEVASTKASFQFLGLPESLMRDFHFSNVTVYVIFLFVVSRGVGRGRGVPISNGKHAYLPVCTTVVVCGPTPGTVGSRMAGSASTPRGSPSTRFTRHQRQTRAAADSKPPAGCCDVVMYEGVRSTLHCAHGVASHHRL